MIGIRADANRKIAMGHIMRCTAIALQLQKLGKDVLFIISEPDMEGFLKENGFSVECLHNAYNQKEQELIHLFEIIDRYDLRMLLVDSYEVTEYYLLSLKNRLPVVYMDDMNLFQYPVDAIINYTYGAAMNLYQKYNYKKTIQFALGSRYVPLREQFAGGVIEKNEEVQNIFISSGGTDPEHMIRDILLAMTAKGFAKMRKTIVVGNFYGDMDWLQEFAKLYQGITIYKNVSNVADIMRKCDVAVSASGTTLAELCACGVPTIAFSMADNQIPGVTAYAKDGLMIYAGDIRDHKSLVLENIIDNMQLLMDNKEMRFEISMKAHSKIDGQGAGRIAEFLTQF